MSEKYKNQKGITLIALVVTIIILLLLASVGIGTMIGMRANILETKSSIAMSDLTKIQQVVLETYIKYKQTNNTRLLKGIKVTRDFAEEKLDGRVEGGLKMTSSYDIADTSTDPSIFYYKLESWHLKEIGVENSGEDEYIVNYSTGEVFSVNEKLTENGKALYVCGE